MEELFRMITGLPVSKVDVAKMLAHEIVDGTTHALEGMSLLRRLSGGELVDDEKIVEVMKKQLEVIELFVACTKTDENDDPDAHAAYLEAMSEAKAHLL